MEFFFNIIKKLIAWKIRVYFFSNFKVYFFYYNSYNEISAKRVKKMFKRSKNCSNYIYPNVLVLPKKLKVMHKREKKIDTLVLKKYLKY